MRSSRLLSILILLQLRGRQTAAALAQEFEVSERTIYRDIDALSAAGVPVYGEPGPSGGFRLLDGYRTRLTGMNADEAEAAPLAWLPEQAAALGLGDAAGAARVKLLAALTEREAGGADRIGERLHLDMTDWYRAARPVPFLVPLLRAVLDERSLSLTYRSWTATRDWDVAPLGLVLKGGDWYLCGLARGRMTTFNVADIAALVVADAGFERPRRFDLRRWWHDEVAAFEARLRPATATVRLSAEGALRLASAGRYAAAAIAGAPPADAAGWRTVSLPIENERQAAMLLLGLGPEFHVVAPAPLAALVHDMARAIADRAAAPNSACNSALPPS